MTWNLDSKRPIYAQLIERVQQDIISGVYGPGDKLPSVRELAVEASVNPNTMQKALSELERSGLIHAERTSGRFITEDIQMIQKMKEELAGAHIRDFLQKMSQMGFEKKETLELLLKMMKEEEV